MKTLALLLPLCAVFASTADAESFRIATYNLNYGNRRGDLVLDAIAAAKPDIICFQETTPQSERFLRERLSQTHPHFHSIGHEGRLLAERFALASKNELFDVVYTRPSVGPFGFYSATAKLVGVSVRIVNVHLAPVVLRTGDGIGAALTALSDAETKHRLEIDAIVKSFNPDQPTIVLGDFNSTSTLVAPATLSKLGLIDAFAKLPNDPDTHPTWTWPTRPLPIKLRIDYIFHTPHFTAVESEIIKRDGSDHSLVVAELSATTRDGR